MNIRPVFVSILLSFSFAGCASFNSAELAQIRQRGVSPVVVEKMQDGRVLTPFDVIELSRHGVPDNYIIRQINDAGVDYVLHREDIKRLRDARVSPPVMDALIAASHDFAGRYYPGRAVTYSAYGAYPYDAYYGGYPYAYPYGYPYYPYGGVSVEVGGGRYWGGRHWR